MNNTNSSRPKNQENIAANGKYRLAAAKLLAEKHGLKLFPVRFRDGKKIPAIKGWQDASTDDPAQLEKWFGAGKYPAIGIDTDKSGLVAVDCDRKHAGIDGVDNFLELAGGTQPDTFTTETATGGLHFLFRGDLVKSTTGQLAKGVDVKSRGGFVVAPGSVTPNGGVYRAAKNAQIADAPQWLIDTIARAYTATAPARQAPASVELDTDASLEQALAYLADAPIAVEGEGGNSLTFIQACQLKDIGVSEDTALDCMDLFSNWNARCEPPWERDELEVIIHNAYQYGANSPGSDSVTLDFDEILDEIADKIGTTGPANDNGPAARDVLARGTLDLRALAGKPVPPRDWLVEGWIPGGNVTLLYGDGGTGKSLAAMQLAVATATGTPWFGLSVAAGRALYLTAEDDSTELHRRMVDIANDQGLSLDELADSLKPISLAADDPALAKAGEKDRLRFTPLWRELAGLIGTWKPRLVVLDTLADIFAGNENVRTQARAFIGALRAVAIEHGAAFVVLAHPSRAGLEMHGNNAAAGSSGSTAWHNSVRSRLLLKRDDKTGLRTLSVVKANYGEVGAEIRLRWQDGAFHMECGAMADAEAAKEVDRVFMDLLDDFTASGRSVGPNPSSNYAPALFAEDERSGMFDAKQLTAAMNRLFAAGVIRVSESGPPTKRRGYIVRSDELVEAA